MVVTTLKEQAESLASSSKFTGGNKFSFKVTLDDEVSLPGRFDAAKYLDDLDIKDLTGLTVVVVCAGNGGLIAESVKRGAKLVLSCEPRYHYHKALPSVLSMIVKPKGSQVGYLPSWPRGDEKADLVIWPDGLQDSTTPRAIIRKILSSLKEGGVAYIEAVIGILGKPAGSVNAWRPTEAALEGTIQEEAKDFGIEKVGPGRADNRSIYRVSVPSYVVVDMIDAEPEVAKPTKKKKAVKPKKKATVKKKATAKKKAAKRVTKKEKAAMNLTGMKIAAVRAEVALWGKPWLDRIIKDHAKEEKAVKAYPRRRGTTSDNIGFSPIPKKK